MSVGIVLAMASATISYQIRCRGRICGPLRPITSTIDIPLADPLMSGSLVDTSLPLPPSKLGLASSFRRIAFSDGDELDMIVSSGCSQLHEILGVAPRVLSEDLLRRILKEFEHADFPWTTDRHSLHPTTDCEVCDVPWLEAEMAVLLKERLMPAIASLFRVDKDSLFLRDQFVVKYSCLAGCQRGLETHHDESCFSYVIQLNDPEHFSGGGTKFEHSVDAISVPKGHALLFCGYTMHTGVQVTEGSRYILTGFVDYRAPVELVRPFYGALPGILPMVYGAGSNDFPSPHLTTNHERLSEAYDGARGEALLRSIAYSPPALGAHVDLSQLQSRCAAWLEYNHVVNARFYAFLQASVAAPMDEDSKVDGEADGKVDSEWDGEGDNDGDGNASGPLTNR